MGIYRGPGGTGESSSNTAVTEIVALSNTVLQAKTDAEAAATSAASSATAAATSASNAASSAADLDAAVTAAQAAQAASETAQEGAEEAQDAALAAQVAAEAAKVAAEAAEDALVNVYTKTEADDLLDLKANQATTYTKTEADALLATKANQATTYTKTEVDGALATKQASDTELTTLSGMSANRATFLASEQAFGFRNRLINANPIINQRGYVSGTATTTANQYTLDRWRVVVSGQNVAWTDSGLTRTVTCPAGGFEQVIESLNIEGGTFVLNWTGTATATVNGTAVVKGGTFTLPANTNATVRFSGGTLAEPQLEAGSVATPFERRPYGTELALCQRYFQQFADRHMGLTASGSQTYTGGVSLTTTMRAVPTLAAGASFSVGAGTAGTPALNQNATAATSSPDFAMIWNSASNWTTGVYVEFNGGLTSEL